MPLGAFHHLQQSVKPYAEHKKGTSTAVMLTIKELLLIFISPVVKGDAIPHPLVKDCQPP